VEKLRPNGQVFLIVPGHMATWTWELDREQREG
jgi:hypothetical protein